MTPNPRAHVNRRFINPDLTTIVPFDEQWMDTRLQKLYRDDIPTGMLAWGVQNLEPGQCVLGVRPVLSQVFLGRFHIVKDFPPRGRAESNETDVTAFLERDPFSSVYLTFRRIEVTDVKSTEPTALYRSYQEEGMKEWYLYSKVMVTKYVRDAEVPYYLCEALIRYSWLFGQLKDGFDPGRPDASSWWHKGVYTMPDERYTPQDPTPTPEAYQALAGYHRSLVDQSYHTDSVDAFRAKVIAQSRSILGFDV